MDVRKDLAIGLLTTVIIFKRKTNMKIKEGDLITLNGISYVVERDEEGTLWGVSNNAESEIELSEYFVPDALFSIPSIT